MSNVINFDEHANTGVHILGQCEPMMDNDTHLRLLALMTDMVHYRDRTDDPEAAAMVETLGSIIERHEPKP